MAETRIIRVVSYNEWNELILKRKGCIKVSPHTFFRLSEMQRKVFKGATLIGVVTGEKPVFVGIQQNGNYAVFFSRKDKYMRVICKVTDKEMEIITFYVTDHIPQI